MTAEPRDDSPVPVPPAPGADEHPALALANTRITLRGGRVVDALETAELAAGWLVDRGLAVEGDHLHARCSSRLCGLREHIRELLRARTAGDRPDPCAVEAVNEAMGPASIAWDVEHGLHRLPVRPGMSVLDHALAVFAADAAELLTGPDADRLAACQAPSCIRYLLRTHARRQWCSTQCGDRVRAARAYARRTA